MGWITHGEHQHICPTCRKSWTHKGYSCEYREESSCLACSGPPPDPKTAAFALALYWSRRAQQRQTK